MVETLLRIWSQHLRPGKLKAATLVGNDQQAATF
jgi:hypothetical protein